MTGGPFDGIPIEGAEDEIEAQDARDTMNEAFGAAFPERRCIAQGKQVLLDGRHFADATSEAAAVVIADCVEYFGLDSRDMTDADAVTRVESYLA